jgi:hypothetical protein
MSDTLPIDLNSAVLGIGRDVSGIADPFNGHIDEFRLSHLQRSDGWITTTWNNMSDPGAFAAAGAEEQEGGEPPPLAGWRGRLSDGTTASCLASLYGHGSLAHGQRQLPPGHRRNRRLRWRAATDSHAAGAIAA